MHTFLITYTTDIAIKEERVKEVCNIYVLNATLLRCHNYYNWYALAKGRGNNLIVC